MSTPADPEAPRTRDRILDVALELFTENGYDGTSMREIAERLSITKPALYYHFDSKEDIVRTLLADIEQQTTELVAWAREQPFSTELRVEVLARWSEIMQAHGLTAFRFFVANRRIVLELSPDRSGMHTIMGELYEILAPATASVTEQLRVRLALMTVNMAGMVGAGIDAPDEEILASARLVASELMPD
ncbi:AcrR family transcriptional regulator [Marmoricola sp. OAE513]|uniref:TetR/AcrR family transcriptional regulator n=1 Tax=Marmoricola sp. OAE513 TaxID=2817894 RepID=UPI001AE529DE